jgi:hypothetical protein
MVLPQGPEGDSKQLRFSSFCPILQSLVRSNYIAKMGQFSLAPLFWMPGFPLGTFVQGRHILVSLLIIL